MTKHNKLSRWN